MIASARSISSGLTVNGGAIRHTAPRVGHLPDVHRQAELHAALRHLQSELMRRLARFAILHQLDAEQQSLATHVADHFVARLELQQAILQALAHRAGIGGEPFVLEHVENGQPHRGRQRIGHVRSVIGEAFAVAILFDFGTGRGGGERQSAAQRFGHRQDVGRHAQALEGKIAAGTPERGLRLVEDQQHAALVAELAQAA